ncbi:non-homologous end joining protein Ku [Legionella septentrionalis]|uniref:non-homologous end joining protein Ku n=1 Tax=Legionella septentrionalis TaxID=2498109 RepID=UPI000F8CD55C|nr:Ku protein [Legionella septentrionalis]RUQ99344.1 Ku protein [Legionella septentrionalis]RUR08767.1 Ku protein [Legionella septentrionalis]
MRAIWSGSISFGLVNIPVKIYSAVENHTLNLDLLRRQDLCPIRYSRVCQTDGKEVPWEDIAKGYEYRNGDIVLLEKKDFAEANVKKTHAIEISEFVLQEEIDSIFYETPYYLAPQKDGIKAYALLREALKKTKKVGVGEFVLRTHESLVIIKPYHDALLLNKLRYKDDIRETKSLNLPEAEHIKPAELKMAMQLIEQLTEEFKPEVFKDTYMDDLKKLIEAKAKGKKVKTAKPAPAREKVTDIMELLKKSIQAKAVKGR